MMPSEVQHSFVDEWQVRSLPLHCENFQAGIRGRTEQDQVIGAGAGEGASLVIVGVTVRSGAGVLEVEGVGGRVTSVRRRVGFTAAVYRVVECQASAFASHTLTAPPFPTRHPQGRRAGPIQVHQATGGGAAPALAALRHNQHRQVVPVHEADVVEVQPLVAVEGELRQGGWGYSPASRAGYLPGSAVAGGTCEFCGGIPGAVCPAPYPTRPRGGHRKSLGLATLELESSRVEDWPVSSGQNSGPYCMPALVHYLERRRLHSCNFFFFFLGGSLRN